MRMKHTVCTRGDIAVTSIIIATYEPRNVQSDDEIQ